MKNRAIIKYLVQLAVYTVIYAAAVAILAFLFFVVGYGIFSQILTGRVRDFASSVYSFVGGAQFEFVIITYTIGFFGVTFHNISRLEKLLILAESSVTDEKSKLYSEDCPEELRQLSARLTKYRDTARMNEQARQLAEQQKNDLIVYLAHDLKTPLTSVIGYLSILEESPDLPPEQRAKYVGITLDKAYRLEQLINEFFEITRLNLSELSAEKTNVDLSVMLLQLAEEFFPLLSERRMTLITDIDSGIKLYADADKLARALDNLLKNAVNYGWDDSEVRLSARVIDENAVITMTNKGDEIPQEKLARIFDKFFRLDSSRRSKTGGAGLGLAITKQLIELNSGTISAACSGNDITFTIMLPM
ncbi:MAG: sensor histidine kinase [Oscillospiraceae bacterium]